MKKIMWAVLIVAVLGLLVFMPEIHITAGEITSSSFAQYLRVACYFLPMGTVSAILSLIMGFWVFRIIVAIVKAIWSILPVGGDS